MKAIIAGSFFLAATGCFYDHHLHEDRYVNDGGPVSQFVARLDDEAPDLQVQGREEPDVQVHGIISGKSHRDIAATTLSLASSEGRTELLFGTPNERFAGLDWAGMQVPADADVDLSTGSGNVQVRGMRGGVHAGSGSGDLEVETTGLVDIQTGSGTIQARGSSGSASTGSGDVFFVVTEGASGTLRLHTGSGDVSVKLPRDLGVDLQASTSSGRIHVNAGGVRVEQDGSAQVRLGGGGLAISVSSGSGDVTIGE